jgi:regulator of chromosome condensation
MNGNFGLVHENPEKCLATPQLISDVIGAKVMKISSGDNHLAMLTEDRKVFTCGIGEQGQLGRPVDQDVGSGTITRSRSRAPKLSLKG